MSKQNTFRLDKHLQGGTLQLFIYGDIGMDFFGDGVNAQNIVELITNNKDVADIEVRINSGGGSLFDGVAIHAALVQHPAPVAVFVDGIAASSASIIVMSGNTISMAEGSMIMIHNAMTDAHGDAREFQKKVDLLLSLNEQMANIYANRTGISAKDIMALMDVETWFTAKEAVEQGFATDIFEAEQIAASIDFSPFNYKNLPTLLATGRTTPSGTNSKPKLSASNQAQNGDSKMSKILAQAAGLHETATDAEIVAEMANIRNAAKRTAELDTQLSAANATIKSFTDVIGEAGDKAVGVVAAWKASHEQLAKNNEELEAIKVRADVDKKTVLIKTAKDEGKLTADLEKFALTCNLETLEGFLASLGKTVPIKNRSVPREDGKSDPADSKSGYSFDGVDYADMTGRQKAAFARADKPQWQLAHDAAMDSHLSGATA